MLERPTRPASHPPAGRPVALVRANPPTLSFYRWLYERIGADFTWTARRLMPDAELTAVIADPAVEIYVLLVRSEEHTSELQSLMRISYAVFCLNKKKTPHK